MAGWRKSPNSCFCHFPASSLTPWLQAEIYLLQIIHLIKKVILLPRNDRVAGPPDDAMISALVKTSEGPTLPIAILGVIAQEADAEDNRTPKRLLPFARLQRTKKRREKLVGRSIRSKDRK